VTVTNWENKKGKLHLQAASEQALLSFQKALLTARRSRCHPKKSGGAKGKKRAVIRNGGKR